MASEQPHQTADDIFLRARQMDESTREGYLREACRDNALLETEVRQLLKADEESQKDGLWQQRPASTEETPPSVGHYRIERELGAGGFGRVFLGWDEQLSRKVAIKIPRSDAVSTPEQFLSEARKLAAIQFSNVVRIYDFGQSDAGICYAVYEYIDGETLAAHMEEHSLDQVLAAELIGKVARALGHVHEHGIYHRDVKPANIILDRRGEPFLIDFGIAVQQDDWSQRFELSGTPSYMSPEQASGEVELDGRSDVFSLGTVLYEMLTGKQAFAGSDVLDTLSRIQFKSPQRPSELVASLHPEMERICLKALAKSPEDRYSTAHAFSRELVQFLESQRESSELSESHASSLPVFRGTKARKVELPLLLVGCLAVLAVVAIAALWMWPEPEGPFLIGNVVEDQDLEAFTQRLEREIEFPTKDEVMQIAEEATGDDFTIHCFNRTNEHLVLVIFNFTKYYKDVPGFWSEIQIPPNKQATVAQLPFLRGMAGLYGLVIVDRDAGLHYVGEFESKAVFNLTGRRPQITSFPTD